MKFIFKIILGLNLILITSCSTMFYMPNAQNVPLIKEKDEWAITTVYNEKQFNLQGAYGLGNSTALQLNTFLISPMYLLAEGVGGGLIELGGGYYKNLNDNFLFDTYILVGIGQISNNIPYTTVVRPNTGGEISANLLRFGIQPSVSYMTDYFSFSLSSRFVNLKHYNIQGELYSDGINQVYYLNRHRSNFLIEPAITVRGGWEIVKLQLQYLRSFNLSNPNFPQDNEVWTLGLNFQF